MKNAKLKLTLFIIVLFLSNVAICQFPQKYKVAGAEVKEPVMFIDNKLISDINEIQEFKNGAGKDIFWNINATDAEIEITAIHLLSKKEAEVFYGDSSVIYEMMKREKLLILQSKDTLQTARELLNPLLKHAPINFKVGKTPLNKKQYTYQPCIYLNWNGKELSYPMVSLRIKTIGKRFSTDNVIGAENNQLNKSAVKALKTNENEDWFLYQEKVIVFNLVD